MQKKVSKLEQKVNDTDRYSHRYNPHVYGVAEEREENIKVKRKRNTVMVKQSWQQCMWLIALAE